MQPVASAAYNPSAGALSRSEIMQRDPDRTVSAYHNLRRETLNPRTIPKQSSHDNRGPCTTVGRADRDGLTRRLNLEMSPGLLPRASGDVVAMDHRVRSSRSLRNCWSRIASARSPLGTTAPKPAAPNRCLSYLVTVVPFVAAEPLRLAPRRTSSLRPLA